MPDIALLGLLIPFLISYIILVLGVKLLRIQPVTQGQLLVFVIGYVLLGLLIGQVVGLIIPSQLTNESSRLLLIAVSQLTSILVSSLVGYILIRYYLKLSGKQLWQLLIFLVVGSSVVYLALALPQLMQQRNLL